MILMSIEHQKFPVSRNFNVIIVISGFEKVDIQKFVDQNMVDESCKAVAFNFQIVNFPDLSGNIPNKHSYGVFVSQLIRYARCCDELADFTNRSEALVKKLTKQNFLLSQLRRVFERFTATHHELLFKYSVSSLSICDSCC